MLFFVTWEVFLLLAGILGVRLLLPVHEFSEGWCQVPVVQCTAACSSALQLYIHQLWGIVYPMQVGPSDPQWSLCADILSALLLERLRWWACCPPPRPLVAGQGNGTMVWGPTLWARLGAELQTELAERKMHTWSGSFCLFAARWYRSYFEARCVIFCLVAGW